MGKQFIRDSIGSVIALTVVALSGIAWNLLTGRLLGPTGVGVLAIVILCPTLAFSLGGMTFGLGTVYQLGSKKHSRDSLITNSLLVGVVAGVILYITFAVTAPLFAASLYRGVPLGYLCLSFTAVIFHLVLYQLGSVLQGMGRIGSHNVLGASRHLVSLISLLALMLLIRAGIMEATVSFVAGAVVSCLLCLYYVKRVSGFHWSPDLSLLWKTLSISGKLHLATVATLLYSQIGLLVANYYLSSQEVGFLFIALAGFQLLSALPRAAQTVLYPRTASETEEEAVQSVETTCRNTVFWTVVMALGLVVFGRWGIRMLLGEQFYPSLAPLWILLPGAVMSVAAQVSSALWIRMQWYWFMAASGIGIAVVGIVLQFVLVPLYGVQGSAWASSLTYLLGFLIVATVYYLRVNKRIWQLFLLQRSDVAVYWRLCQQVVRRVANG